MSSTGNAAADDDELEEAPGLWTSFGIALRLIVGWFCLAIGVLNLLVEVDRTSGEPDVAYFVFHSVLFVGGMVLLSVSLLGRRPGVPGYVAGAATAVIGMVASAIPVTPAVCCMTAFDVRHGWPFTFVARDEGAAARWHIDSQHLLADLLFWGYVGLMVLVVVALVRRVTSPEHEEADIAPLAGAGHAEQRAITDDVRAADVPSRADPVRQRADGS